jgi:hypothetical protein
MTVSAKVRICGIETDKIIGKRFDSEYELDDYLDQHRSGVTIDLLDFHYVATANKRSRRIVGE